MEAPSCSLCSRLLRKTDERRVLHSSVFGLCSTRPQQKYFQAALRSFSLLTLTPVQHRSVEKLLRLRENLHKEEKDLRIKLERMGERKCLSIGSSQVSGENSDRGGKLITQKYFSLVFTLNCTCLVTALQLTPMKATSTGSSMKTPSPKHRRIHTNTKKMVLQLCL